MDLPRLFHLGDVLSVITGIAYSPRGYDGIVDILSFMTGTNLRIDDFVRAQRDCRAALLRDSPLWRSAELTAALAAAEAHMGRKSIVRRPRIMRRHREGMERRFGAVHPVFPLPPGSFVGTDPLKLAEGLLRKGKLVTFRIAG